MIKIFIYSVQSGRAMGMVPILLQIYQTEQVLGLWKGMTPVSFYILW